MGASSLKLYRDAFFFSFLKRKSVLFVSSVVQQIMCQAQGEILFAELIFKAQEGRKVPFKGQNVSGFQFGIFLTFKVFPCPTRPSALRSRSDVLHMFTSHSNFGNSSPWTSSPKQLNIHICNLRRGDQSKLAGLVSSIPCAQAGRDLLSEARGECWS